MKNLTRCIALFAICLAYSISSFSQEGNIQWTANWSADGQYIAVGGTDKIIRIYDGNTFELIKRDTINAIIQRMRWHPTKNILAVAALQNGSRLVDYDKDTTFLLDKIPNIDGRSIVWNLTGDKVAVADYFNKLSIWNSEGKPLKVIVIEANQGYTGVDWHPKKDEIIILSEFVRVIDLNGKLLKEFPHRKETVLKLCVKWHPSGKFFVLGDYGDYDFKYPAVLQYWNADYTLKKEIILSKAEYRNISWDTKGKRLASTSEALRIWNKKGELLHEGKSENLLWGVDWSPNGKYLVTSSKNAKIMIWDAKAKLVKELEL